MAPLTERSGMTIAALEKILEKRRGELQSLTKERLRVLKKLAAVDARLRAISGGAGLVAPRAGRSQNPLSLASTMAAVLEKAGKPLSVREIVKAVLDTGYQSASVNFQTQANQMLIRERKRFANVGRAMYALK
jgi:hypothetical protein